MKEDHGEPKISVMGHDNNDTYPSVRGAALDEALRLQEGGSGKGNKAGQESNTHETK